MWQRLGSRRLDNPILFAAATILSVVPLWLPEFLPLVDVPQHAAQVASLRQLWGGSDLFREDFVVNWFTPYLGGYLLMFLASTVLPIVPATKVVVSATVIGVPVLTGLLLREVGSDERLKWLAIPAGYSFAFYWGFLVYAVAVPAALAFLWMTIRFDTASPLKRSLAIAAFSVVVYFCHVIALGFGSLVALAYLLGRHWRSPLKFVGRVIPYMTPLPFMALWMTRVYGTEASLQDGTVIFAPVKDKLVILFNQFSGLDGSSFSIGLLIAGVVLALPFLGGCRVSTRPERWLPLVAGIAVYMIFPYYMQSTAYLYQRLAVFLVPLWLMIWDAPASPRPTVLIVAMAAVAVWIGSNVERFARFASESMGFSLVLQEAEPGRRMAGMLLCNGTEYFTYPVYLHFHAWYQATSGGIADNSFAMTHPSMVRYRDLTAPRVGDLLAWEPGKFDWSRDGGDSYDYFLVCAGEDASALIFKDRTDSVRLVARAGSWWLYERQPAVASE